MLFKNDMKATISPPSSTIQVSAIGTSSRISGSIARQCSSGRNWPGTVEASHTRIMSSSSAGSKARITSEPFYIGRP
jgi:hypothetical protein